MDGANVSRWAGAQSGFPASGLRLWADKADFEAGDDIVLFVESERDCRLNLINVDPSGEAVVLFPNFRQDNNRLAVGRRFRIPSQGGGFRFRLSKRGRETFIAICLMGGTREAPPGVRLRLDQREFALLGPWRSVLARMVGEEVAEVRRGRAPPYRRLRMRRKGIGYRTAPGPLPQMRAVLSVEVGARPGRASVSVDPD